MSKSSDVLEQIEQRVIKLTDKVVLGEASSRDLIELVMWFDLDAKYAQLYDERSFLIWSPALLKLREFMETK
jgi:hypothetical protein